jgi:fibronectin-binding autotransporter adhesin
MQKNPALRRLLLAVSIAIVATQQVCSFAAIWNADADGLWSDPANWTGGVPNSVGAIADLSAVNISANRTITLDGNFTAGSLRFGDTTSPWYDWFLLPPSGNTTNTLTLDVATIYAPTISVVRNLTIGVVLSGNKGLTFEEPFYGGTVVLTGANTYTGDTTVKVTRLVLGDGGTTGSLASTIVRNQSTDGIFEIRRADFYPVPFAIISGSPVPKTAGTLIINSGVFDTPNTGASINGVVDQKAIGVGSGYFGRLFLESGADITIERLYVANGQLIQNGGTVDANWARVGDSSQAGSVSTYTLNNGSFTLTGTFSGSPFATLLGPLPEGVLVIGRTSMGEVAINGGTLDVKAIVLDDLDATDGIDRLTVNGGIVRVGGVGPGDDADPANCGSAITSKHTSATYAVDYTGGTIQATGNFLHSVDATFADTNGGIKFDSNGNVITATGVFSGTGGLIKIGSGSLRLKAMNTYAGDTTIDGGSLIVAGSLLSTGKVVVHDGGILRGAGNGVATGLVGNVIDHTGGSIRPGADAIDNSIGTLTMESLELNGGNLKFDVNPTNVTTGSGINDLIAVKGHVTLNGGTIELAASGVPVPGTYTLVTSSGITATQLPIVDLPLSRRTYTVGMSGSDVQVTVGGSAPLSLLWSGGLDNNLWNINAASNWRSNTPNDQKFFNFDSVTFDDSGSGSNVNLAQVVYPNSTIVNASKDYTFAGPGGIGYGGMGPGSLTKAGSGTLTLLTNNTYAGATTITGGTLQVGNGGSTGTLGGSSLIVNQGNVVFNRSDVVTVDQSISGSGNLVKSGAGTLILRGANTYSGITRIDAGTLEPGTDNTLSPNSVIEFSGGKLEINGTNQTVGGIKGVSGTINGAGLLTVDQSTNTTFSGVINTRFKKMGAGTLTLANAVIADQAEVAGGTLVVEGGLSGASFLAGVFLKGGTLIGKGTVPPLSLNSGTIAPGPGPAILTAPYVDFYGGTFALELNGTTAGIDYDQLIVDGLHFALHGVTNLTISLGFDPVDDVDSFTIVKSPRLLDFGFFKFGSEYLSEGELFTVGFQPFRITYEGGPEKNDIILFAVPEPDGLAGLFASCGLLLCLQRFRRLSA